MNNINFLRKQLYASIDELISNYKSFLTDNENYFSRERKLPLKTLVESILFMRSNAIKDELYDLFNFHNTPTTSAFVQQRKKLRSDAFRFLFGAFNRRTSSKKSELYRGYKLLAIDGSTIPISHNPNDFDTYMHFTNKNGDPVKGANAFHLNAMYDLLEHLYIDVVIQGEAHKREIDAFKTMINRYNDSKAIFIADRNYESLNLFVHVMKTNNKYLIRVKDIHSNGLLSSLPKQENEEFDIDYEFIATTKQTKEVKAHKEKYKFLSNASVFDHFEGESKFYPIKMRIVRLKRHDDYYESIITNLDKNEFSAEDIKYLYGIRWGVETSFRELKYAVGLNAFHAKNRESIKQEIYAKLLFYNFSEKIIRKFKPRKSKLNRKYLYAINSTRAFHSIRVYLKTKGGKKPPDIESILINEIEPIRPDRSDPRKVKKAQAPVHFLYRYQ